MSDTASLRVDKLLPCTVRLLRLPRHRSSHYRNPPLVVALGTVECTNQTTNHTSSVYKGCFVHSLSLSLTHLDECLSPKYNHSPVCLQMSLSFSLTLRNNSHLNKMRRYKDRLKQFSKSSFISWFQAFDYRLSSVPSSFKFSHRPLYLNVELASTNHYVHPSIDRKNLVESPKE